MKEKENPSIGDYFLSSFKKQGPEAVFMKHVLGYQYTYQDIIQKVAILVQFFKNQGIQKGDRIVCYWEETTPGVLFALACALSGVVLVPLSPIFSVFYLKNLINQNGAKAVFTTLDRMSILEEGELEPYCSDDFINPEVSYHYEYTSRESLVLSKLSFQEAQTILESSAANIQSEDIFMVQPTSGSTGQPKLVLRSHTALCRYAIHVGPQIQHENNERPRFLMVAALTHAFGFHMLTTALSEGAELLIPSRIDTGASLQEVRELNPTVVPLVPRILRSFFLQKERAKENIGGDRVFGPGIKFLISAGGSGDPSYFQILHDQGVQILELYGSSEASLISMTPRDGWRPGYAGKILPDVEMKVEEDGELLIRSPGIMAGYYNDEKNNLEAFTQDGFYRSGDLGQIDSQGYLQILGRKKDIFNTAEGSNIYPERLENLLEALPSVKQAILLGDRLPYICALLVINPEHLPEAKQLNPETDYIGENQHKTLYKKIGVDLKKINSQLERVEQIVRFSLFNKPFQLEAYTTVGPGKARRNRKKIQEIYAQRIEVLYYPSQALDVSFVPGMDRRIRPHSDLRVHLIWLSKDHKSLIRREVGEKLKPMIKELCHQMNVHILSGNVARDHVHLFISYPPELSVSEIVSKLKRTTSAKIFHSLPQVQEEAMGKNLWDQGYLAVTSGTMANDLIERYVSAEEGLTGPLLAPVDESSIVIPVPEL
jgi:long-chain acyl-CoA synthetase